MTGRVLVTGASGFIGRALVADLAAAGHPVCAAMRQPADIFARTVEVVAVSDLTRPVEWRALLKGIKTVVHLAGIAQAGPEIAEQAYDRVNRLATAELAQAAQRMGVQRLVFASSIRAQSGPVASSVLDETGAPNPTDAYGRSKLAAEQAIREFQCAVHHPAAGIGLWAGSERQSREAGALGKKSLAAAVRIILQPPIDPGAAEPDRCDSFFATHARHPRRNLCGGRSRASDACRDHHCTTRWPRPVARPPADAPRADRRGPQSSRPGRPVGSPRRRTDRQSCQADAHRLAPALRQP